MEARSRTRWGRRRRLVAVLVALLATVAGMLVVAGAAQAVGPVYFVNGGTGSPATTLGQYVMTPFGADPAANFTAVTSAPGPTGNVGFSAALEHRQGSALAGGFGGFGGDVYAEDGHHGAASGTTVTLTLPPNTSAFYLYALADAGGTWNVTAQTDNGTSSGNIAVTSNLTNNLPNYFGFYTNDNSSIASIQVTVPAGGLHVLVGEFGISKPVTAAPAFTSAASATFTAGTAGSYLVTTAVDTAHGAAVLDCPSCDVPFGVDYTDNGNGTMTISGTPGNTAGGVYVFTIQAVNSVGTTLQTFTLTVNQ